MTDATAILYTVTLKYDKCHYALSCWKLILGEGVSKLFRNTPVSKHLRCMGGGRQVFQHPPTSKSSTPPLPPLRFPPLRPPPLPSALKGLVADQSSVLLEQQRKEETEVQQKEFARRFRRRLRRFRRAAGALRWGIHRGPLRRSTGIP